MSPGGKAVTGIVGVIVLVAIVIMLLPFTTVSAGQIGIVTRNGAVNRTVQPGLHFRTPLIEHVVKFDVQTQKEQSDASAASSDLQTVNTTVAVNYNIDPTKVADLYTRLGQNFSATVIDPSIQEVVKGVTAKYTAEQLITERAQVTQDIQAGLTERLAPSDILVSGVSITNFSFSSTFEAAIEAKVTAEQNALAAKNKLDQVTYEAQQTVVTAKATAEAQQIQAQSLESQGGQDYVNLQAVFKWDGHLPNQMIPGQSLPFIQVNK